MFNNEFKSFSFFRMCPLPHLSVCKPSPLCCRFVLKRIRRERKAVGRSDSKQWRKEQSGLNSDTRHPASLLGSRERLEGGLEERRKEEEREREEEREVRRKDEREEVRKRDAREEARKREKKREEEKREDVNRREEREELRRREKRREDREEERREGEEGEREEQMDLIIKKILEQQTQLR